MNLTVTQGKPHQGACLLFLKRGLLALVILVSEEVDDSYKLMFTIYYSADLADGALKSALKDMAGLAVSLVQNTMFDG